MFAGKIADFGQIFFAERFGAGGEVVQKGQNLLRRFGHFGGQREFGVVGETQNPRFFQRDFQAAGDVGGVVVFAAVGQFAGAGNVGAVDFGAQFAVVGVFHHGQIVRHLQSDFVAAFAFRFGCGGKHGFFVVGQAFQTAFVRKIQGKGIGCVEYVLRKSGGQLRPFGLQFGQPCLFFRRQFRTAQHEVAQVVFQLGFLRFVQSGEFGRGFDGFETVVQFDVLADFGKEDGYFGHQGIVFGAQFGGIDHGIEMGYHAPNAADAFGDAGQPFDRVRP